jgi:hypothetical protein
VQRELQERNRGLLRDIDDLLQSIAQAQVPHELQPFRSAVERICQSLRTAVLKNLSKLQSPQKATLLLEEIISDTANVIHVVRQMSELLIPALVRDPYGTHLSLKIVSWLHQEHPQTQQYPPVVTDGGWGVYPFVLPIYYVPLLEQRRLLHQPLLFHEFGHQLYRHHKPEMDELVKEFQYRVLRVLTPAVGSNDTYYEQQLGYNQVVVVTWYRWMQELFCDAVGFQIGGPSYLKAFSAALNSIQREDFHIERDDLIGSSHPVAWLRVQFLTQRARAAGFLDLSDEIDRTWRKVASALKIVEDYYGIYDWVLQKDVVNTLEDLLVEAGPRRYQQEELQASDATFAFSPVSLLNKAWMMYEMDPENYPDWEQSVICQYLGMHQSTCVP